MNRPTNYAAVLIALVALLWSPPTREDGGQHAAGEQRFSSHHSLVIVAIDGVRWQELFRGTDEALSGKPGIGPRKLVPNLRRLMAKGGAVLGAPEANSVFRVAGPSFLSLPGYFQLFSGRSRVQCANNNCPRTQHPTLFDVVGREFGRRHSVVVSSWPKIERAAVSSPSLALVSAGCCTLRNPRGFEAAGMTDLLIASKRTSPAPGVDNYRPDHITAQLAYAALQRLRPRLLFIGLGDTDEHAHRGDYNAYLRALRQADRWIGSLEHVARRLQNDGHQVTFFVTTDHGRDQTFDSHASKPAAARTWLIAWGSGVRATGRLSTRGSLADVSPTAALLLGIDIPGATGRVLTELL